MTDVDLDTRQGLRILAETSKTIGTEGVARRLLKAAETGRKDDFKAASTIFNALPIEKRADIRAKAELEAKSVDSTDSVKKKNDMVYNTSNDQVSAVK
mgnify:CR=1 FL=1